MSTPIVTFCGTNKLINISDTPCTTVCICAQNHLYSHWKIAILGGHGKGTCNVVPCGLTYSGACMNIITRSCCTSNWFTDGFRETGVLVIAGSENSCNNGSYTIDTLTNTVMTLCSGACLSVSCSPDTTAQLTQNGTLSAGFDQAFSVSGGCPITASQNLSGYFFLTNGWRVKPVCVPCACKDYPVEGNLIVCGGVGHPFVNTCLPLNTFVTINLSVQSLQVTPEVFLTPCDLTNVENAIWDACTSDHVASGSFGNLMSSMFRKIKFIIVQLFMK